MAFSASEAALEGFRIVRREPGTVAVWAVLLMIFSAVLMALLLPTLRDLLANVPTPGAPVSPATMNPAAQMALFGDVGRLYLTMLPIYLVFMSIFTGAVYRAVLRPQEKGLARLMLGGDELRLLGFFVLFVLLICAFSILLTLAGVLGMVGVGLALKKSPAAWGLGLVVFYLVFVVAYAWLMVRLSLAGPMTFDQKRIRIFGSWKLTKGHFWPLFGCYLLAVIFAILVGIVDALVSGVLAIGMAGGSIGRAATGLFRPDFSSFATLFTPIYIVRLLVGGAFGSVISAVMIAAPAAAYREILAARPEDKTGTFA